VKKGRRWGPKNQAKTNPKDRDQVRVKLILEGGAKSYGYLPQLDAVVVITISEKERHYFRRIGPAEYRIMSAEDATKLGEYMKARRLSAQDLTLDQVGRALKGTLKL
jgi:hypothetical protein